MSETNWGEGEAPPPKKRMPTWLWACGGGCLLAVILGIAGMAFIYSKAKKIYEEGSNPELQWKHVAEVMPLDEHPDGVDLKFGLQVGHYEMYWFNDSHGLMEVLMRLNERDEEQRDKALDARESGGFLGQGKRRNMSAFTVRVQGRDLKGLRFDQMEEDEKKAAEGMPKPGKGPSVLVDLTPESSQQTVFLQIIRLNGTEPVRDEDIQRFLKKFHVGPDR